MTWLSSWAPYFRSDQRVSGRAYYLESRVELLDALEGELLRASVSGSEQSHIVTFQREGGNTVAQCTCAKSAGGNYCKHIWAALLAMEEQGLNADQDTSATQPDATPRPPRARKRRGDRKPTRPVEPAWVGRLSLIRPESFSQPNTPQSILPTLRQVCYVIDVDLSTRHNGLVVGVYQRQPARNGWSKMKVLRINHDMLGDINDPIDRELCGQLIGANRVDKHEMGERFIVSERLHSVFRVPVGNWRTMLQRMIETGRCYVDLHPDRPSVQPKLLSLDYAPEDPALAWKLWLVGHLEPQTLRITVELRRGEQTMPIDQPALILGGSDGLVLYDNKAARFDDCKAFRWARQFRDDLRLDDDDVDILVPRDDVGRFLDRLYLLPSLPMIDLPREIQRREQRIDPVINIEIFSPANETKTTSSSRQILTANLWFDYQGHRVEPRHPGQYAQTADDGSLICRNHSLEREAMELLVRLGFKHNPAADDDLLTLSARQLQQAVNELIARRWVVTADRRLIRTPAPPRLSVTSGMDWFELRGTVTYQTESGEQSVTIPEILAAAKKGMAMIQLDDGSEGMLPEQWLADHGLLASIADIEDDHLRFKTSQTALLDALLRNQEEVDFDEKFAAARDRLAKFDGVDPQEPTEDFAGELRPYQKDGLGWMRFQRWFGMGGILADDMGLGKTIQVLAMFDARYRQSKIYDDIVDGDEKEQNIRDHHPSLIVVPRSVVYNWIDEAKRFTPKLRVLSYTGPDRKPLRDQFADHDLIITSYGLMRRDITELSVFEFDHVILDEAQAIKNPNSQSAKSARLLNTTHRLALTGTPVENHLGDLWSIFEFLNPGMLGSGTRFAQLVRSNGAIAGPNNGSDGDDESQADNAAESAEENGESASYGSRRLKRHAQSAIHIARALRPFILRRTKKQVLSDLPEKTEQTLLCEMDEQQRGIYDELRTHYRNALLKKIDRRATGVGGNAMMVLEALLRLRQAACHPGLINPEYENHASAKLDTLMDQVTELIEEGHKALIFSQFTSMLALVRNRFDKHGITYEYLDGQTRNRKQRVERFQEDPDCPLFLISLRAGGLGLNLTAADYVFILDPWWNPAVESQAIDRAHRIGQTQHVFAYRLICENTVEQRIADLQDKKRQLADAIVGEQENLLRNLTRDDLEMLLS